MLGKMRDIRVDFLSSHSRSLLDYVVNLGHKVISGYLGAHCGGCGNKLNELYAFDPNTRFHIYISDTGHHKWLCLCCFRVYRDELGSSIFEIFPRARLSTARQLCRNGVVENFMFNIRVDDNKIISKRVKFRGGSITEMAHKIVSDKRDYEEIVSIFFNGARGSVRVEHLDDVFVDKNFEVFCEPTIVNTPPLYPILCTEDILQENAYMEVLIKEFHQPAAFFTLDISLSGYCMKNCSLCKDKIYKGFPIIYCSYCGPTPSKVFTKTYKNFDPLKIKSLEYVKSKRYILYYMA
jgi:hypothetical protein